MDTGHEVVVEVNGETILAAVSKDSRQPARGNPHWLCITSEMDTGRIGKPDRYALTLAINKTIHDKVGGFIVRNVNLKQSPGDMP